MAGQHAERRDAKARVEFATAVVGFLVVVVGAVVQIADLIAGPSEPPVIVIDGRPGSDQSSPRTP